MSETCNITFPQLPTELPIPVRNTFVEFRESGSSRSPVRSRSRSCPAWVWPYRAVEGTATWEGATQLLCHAMAPRRERPPVSFSRAKLQSASSTVSQESGTCHTASTIMESSSKAADQGHVLRRNGNAPCGTSLDLGKKQAAQLTPRSDEDTHDTDSQTASTTSSQPAEWQEVRAGKRKSKMKEMRDVAPAPAQQTMAAVEVKGRKITQRFEVGIHADCGFQVAKRIIGTAGANMKHIVSASMGAKVWVTLRDSPLPEGGHWEESMGPLLICVSAMSGPSFDIAKELVQELLDTVRKEHKDFCLSRK